MSCGTGGQASTPGLSPPGGTFVDLGSGQVPVKVNAATSTPGATVRITTDGSDPEPSSPATTSVDIPDNLTTPEQTVVKARAFHDDLTPSGVAQQTYVVKAGIPTLDPSGGTFPEAPVVSITSPTPGGQVRYTLDGSVPTQTSARYEGPIRVECGKTLTAVVFKDRYLRSDPNSGPYSCTPQQDCAALGGIFFATFTVDSDLGGHAPFVNLQSATLTTSVAPTSLGVSGSFPATVTGTWPLDTATCTGSATGRGTVAGFPGIRCDYEDVRLSDGRLTGTYTRRVGDGLPGNQPIRYRFTGAP